MTEQITTLKSNQIFVFGSNLNGSHGGGAAKFAKDNFGAQDGVGEGLTGQSYAFPTLDKKMKKVSKKALIESKKKLYSIAESSPSMEFLVTKVGCGIAGFTEDFMKKIFEGERPLNITLPEGWFIPVIGFKGFDKDFKCRDFQYEVGKEYQHEGEVRACNSGFHFCKNPFDVLNYYPATSRFAQVEAPHAIEQTDKAVTGKLKIVTELSLHAFLGFGVKFILDKVDFKHKSKKATNTGDYSAATNTGDYSAATNTGDYSAATNTGARSAATNTGYQSAATNTGYQSAATNTGDYSAATNTGDYSAATNTGASSAATNTGDYSAATNTGDYSAATNTGEQGCAISIGIEGRASGSLGTWLTLAEWKFDTRKSKWNRIDVQTKKVDGKDIKADTFYVLQDGKFVEVK